MHKQAFILNEPTSDHSIVLSMAKWHIMIAREQAWEEERESERERQSKRREKTVIKEKLCRVDHEYVVSSKLYTTCYNVPLCGVRVCVCVFRFFVYFSASCCYAVSSFPSNFRSFFLFFHFISEFFHLLDSKYRFFLSGLLLNGI